MMLREYEIKQLNKLLLDNYLKIKIKGQEFVFGLKDCYLDCSNPRKEEKYFWTTSERLREGTVSEIAETIKEYINNKL